MDKKYAQNVGITPLSEMVLTGVNSVIFALTAIVIPYFQLLVVLPQGKVSTMSMYEVNKPSFR